MIEQHPGQSPIGLSSREMLAACTAILLVFAIGVGLKASGSKWAGGASWNVGGDFIAFYVAGRILNEHGAARLYDVALQGAVYSDVTRDATTWRHRTFYPPHIAALFAPLARLPFSRALLIFMIATPLVFLGGLLLLNAQFGPCAADERALLITAGLSFFPFLGYTWLGAQISTIGFLAVALALVEEDRDRPFAGGLALSLCLYKPTLLVLLGPMILVTGRLRLLAGLAAGAAIQILVWLAIGGLSSVATFADQLGWTATTSTAAGQLFNPYRYVDANAFVRLLPYGRTIGAYVLLGVVASAAGVALVLAWMRSRAADRSTRLLVWAATLIWTLVMNVYIPVYDTVLVVPAAVVAVAAIRARGWLGWRRLAPALTCVYLAPWITEFCARTFRVQVYTLVLGAFGAVLLAEANRRSE